ncbi:MAG: hypothetical protein ABFS45_18190, partial [Pseudomonadota bacterium]
MPFKGPFKGKGQNRKAARLLDLELESIRVEMKQVVARYNAAFPTTPRQVNLRLQGRPNAHTLLSWRQAVRSGSYLHLFG